MGKFSRDKGALFEREVVTLARTYDLKAQRVPLSGATEYARGDVEITPAWDDAPLVFELKRRRELPGWLLEALGDNHGLILRADRHEAVAIVPLRTLLGMMQ